jgi:hypothetical protein
MAEAPPDLLLEEMRRDLRPVRPILAPGPRAVLIGFIAFLTAGVFLRLGGVRGDLGELSGALFVTALLVRIAAGATLLAIGLREAVPSGGVSHRIRVASLLGTAALLLVLPIGLAQLIGASDAPFTIGQLRCYRFELLIAAPAFAASYWLLARAYPVRPLFAATMTGMGVGLLADAALFAHCPIDAPTHVLIAHEAAVLTLAAAGASLGWLLQRSRRRSFRFAR